METNRTMLLLVLTSALKENTPHATTHTLPIVQNVEPVHKLIDSIAAFCDSTQVGHERHIITLLKKNNINIMDI